MASISVQEKARLASSLIKQAPPGEFKEVILDVRALLNDDSILKNEASKALQEHNEMMFTPVKVEKPSESLITSHARTESNKYIDNRNHIQFTVDHLKRESTGTEPSTLEADLQTVFTPVDNAIQKYVKDYYKNGTSAVYVSGSQNDVTIIICIESHAYSPANFWNGLIQTEYKVNTKSLELTGKIKATIHYYEDGNVQLGSEKQVSGTLKGFKDHEELATLIVSSIQGYETKYQEALVEDIDSMCDITFKALRRQLPITRCKIDWTKIALYAVGQEISK